MAKTKALISAFVFAYADCWFSHAAAHIMISLVVTLNLKIEKMDETCLLLD